jgi:cytochrome c oxidase assembly protein subunit 15
MVGLTQALGLAARDGVAAAPRARVIAVWLFAVALLVFAMVIVGGATRLTGSGLSITEWKPILGAVPPLTPRAWAEAFSKYRASSQYYLINQGISLRDFKVLFWWEWSHRLLGRLVGLVFAAPFIGFLATRRLPRWLVSRCLALLALGALQGFVGWWMVKSGLEGRASVAPERLATHLGLALFLFAALIWTGLEAWSGPTKAPRRDGWTVAGAIFATFVFLQCLMGALVAGNHAGLMDGDWPLMAGRVFPEGYWQGGLWATFAHSLAAVQFNHRIIAYGLLAFAVTLLIRSGAAPRGLRIVITLVCLAVFAQAGLGVATLLSQVALPLALMHQADAAILLALSTTLAWRARRA